MVDPLSLEEGNPCLKKKGQPKKKKTTMFCSDGFSVGLHLPVYLHQKISLNILIISPQAHSSCHDFVILGECREGTKFVVVVDRIGCPCLHNCVFLFFLIIIS